nr:SMC family ATPase [uncultured Treponema sp.]
MRPLKITITGFESYKDKTEINFEALGNKGLYLISGDTGAGKTTIFDAITFALYGSPSGSERSVEMLRSHFADENIPTEVEFEFEANGKKYKVARNPDYERKVFRGSGTTIESASATLTYESEKKAPVSGVKAVTEAIENILNLKKDQFCRIAMIAQGGFQKLLLSKKDEKEKIFRELFHTEKYEKLQAILKSEKTTAENNLKDNVKNLSNALARIVVSETDDNYDKVKEIKLSTYVKDEELKILKDFVHKDEKKVEEIKEELLKLENKIEIANSELQIAETRSNIEKQISASKELLKKKENVFAEACNDLNAAENAAKEVPAMLKNKTILEESLKEYEEIANVQKTIDDLSDSIVFDERKVKVLEKEKVSSFEILDEFKKEFSSLKDAGENIVSLNNELEKIFGQQDELKSILSSLKKLNEEKDELCEVQKKSKDANDAFVIANNSYSEIIQLFNLEQAGILAETLKEGIPCPVCGSIEHPNPASKSEKAPSQKEIEKAKKDVEILQGKASELSLDAREKKTVVEKNEESLNGLLKKSFDDLTVNDDDVSGKVEAKIHELSMKSKEIKERLSKEMNDKSRREELDEKIPELEKEIDLQFDAISKLKEQISAEKSSLESEEKNLSKKKEKLSYDSLDSAKNELKKLNDKILKLNDALEKSRKVKSDCENDIAGINGTIIGLEEQLGKTNAVDMDKVSRKKSELQKTKEQFEDIRDSLTERKGVNTESVKNIEGLLPKISEANDSFNMISALYEVASGSSRGKTGKPSLENYVQMKCLDQINRRANLRLKTMTDNKFELRRKIEEDGSELGLDLNVKDFYTGRERQVQTLSGGEQFQASLSLALGLADEIQANAGGINLDAMFIDEGFGTLDGDTLNKAMKALEDLSQGNKLVGIISHVDELESRIPKKIHVKKDDAGVSHVKMVLD